jgi:demethylmenaquinone methyltransferase / 2-methoxy-6-polyprenyl-1,4-benzoquinol methylase
MKSGLTYQLDNNNPRERKKDIQGMFDSIVSTYDFLNWMLSLGIDRGWRKKTIKMVKEGEKGVVLDLCCGTGALSRQMIKEGIDTMSLDFSFEMLKTGKDKGSLGNSTVQADASAPPFASNSFSACTVAFGIRNIPDLDTFIAGTLDILKPGGELLILELTRPRNPVMRALYNIYLHNILPLVGGLVSGRPVAYKYLAGTIASFINPVELARRFKEGGYGETEIHSLSAGIATLLVCRKSRT